MDKLETDRGIPAQLDGGIHERPARVYTHTTYSQLRCKKIARGAVCCVVRASSALLVVIALIASDECMHQLALDIFACTAIADNSGNTICRYFALAYCKQKTKESRLVVICNNMIQINPSHQSGTYSVFRLVHTASYYCIV